MAWPRVTPELDCERQELRSHAARIDGMIAPAADSSDEAFAARAAAGDDAAFEALLARYQHRVYRLACRLTSETDAPDVVQETFLQVYRHLETFRGDARFST